MLIKRKNIINETEWPKSYPHPRLSYKDFCSDFIKYFEDSKDRNKLSEDDEKMFEEREFKLEQEIKEKMLGLCLEYDKKVTFGNIWGKIKKLFKEQK
jgi:hypothetical protein